MRLRSLSQWSADLNLDDRDLVRANSDISVDATVRTVRRPVRKSQAGAPEDAQVRIVRPALASIAGACPATWIPLAPSRHLWASIQRTFLEIRGRRWARC